MSTPLLSPEAPSSHSQAEALARVACRRALDAVLGLAKALASPGAVKEALKELEQVTLEVEELVMRLQEEQRAAVAELAEVRIPTPGVEPRAIYGELEALAGARIQQLKKELRENQRRQQVLWLARNVAALLTVVGMPLMALDVVRSALGMTQESHVVPTLSTLTLLCQLTLWGFQTSREALGLALERQKLLRDQYHQLAAQADPQAAEEAAEAAAAGARALGTLRRVSGHLRDLGDAVGLDLELSRGFSESSLMLGTILEELGALVGDVEGVERSGQGMKGLPGYK